MKTKIVKKKRFNVARTLVFVLFIYIIVCFLIYLYKEPVKHFYITGNSIVSDVEIIRSLGLENYPSYVSINPSKLEKKLKDNKFIKSVDISYGLNFKINIKVEENIPILVLRSTNEVVLSNGVKIDNSREFIGLPILLNSTPNEVLNILVDELSYIDPGIRYMINDIEYAPSYDSTGRSIDDKRFLLSMNDKNMVYITAKKTEVLNEYLNIISNYKIVNNGTLFLDGTEGRYPFKYASTTETTTTKKVEEEVEEDEE